MGYVRCRQVRENRSAGKQKCRDLGSAEDEVLCLGVRLRIWGRFFARRHAKPFHGCVRVGAGVVLGGVGTLASPLAEGCLVCMRCGVRRATQASPPVFLGVQGDASVPTLRGMIPLPQPPHEKPTLGHNPLISVSTRCRSSLRRALTGQSSSSHKPYPLNPLPMRLARRRISREPIKQMPIIFNLLSMRIRHNTQRTWKSISAHR